MTENYPKSKLKRKKSSVEELRTETASRGAAKKNGPPAAVSGGVTAQTVNARSVAPEAAWWNREQLPAVENLWMLTLKSALPYLDNHHWDLVPDLPHPSILKPSALKSDEQRWCDLQEEVAPLPEPALSPDPLRLCSSQQDLSVQTSPASDPPDRQRSSLSRQHRDGKTASVQSLPRNTQPSPHSWEEAASSVQYSDVGREETGAVSRQEVSDMLQKGGENREEAVGDEAVREAQASFREDGGAAAPGGGGRGEEGLQSCPMCLMGFPVGFTQMDCDGHLAQCLSEMNVDMSW